MIKNPGGGKRYDSDIEKMLDKPDHTLAALIRGLDDSEEITEWIETEIDGEGRQDVIAALNRRKGELDRRG